MVFSLSALWWRRVRALCKLPDGRDWLRRKLGLVLMGGATLQFSSVAQSCPTLCDPMDCSTPGLPVHHQLLEFTQTYAHRVGDAIEPSHPLLSPSPLDQSFPASGSFPMSQFFTSGRQSTGVSASTSFLPMNIQDWFSLGWIGWISLQSKGLSRGHA